MSTQHPYTEGSATDQIQNTSGYFTISITLFVAVIWASFTFWPVNGGIEILARLASIVVSMWAIVCLLYALLWILRLLATADQQSAHHQAAVSELRARNLSNTNRKYEDDNEQEKSNRKS